MSPKKSLGISLSLPLFSGFQTYNGVKEVAARVKIDQAKYDIAISSAICEARCEYVNLMCAYEEVELLAKIKKRRIENKDLIKLKYNLGMVHIGSLKMKEAEVAIADYDVRRAQRDIETASTALLEKMGRNNNTVILETDEKLYL